MQYFLHDRPWISPWIKSISNEFDITIHVIASQLSGYSDVINNRLWHHQQNGNPASKARGRCVKLVAFIVICTVVFSCKKENNVCTRVTTCFCTHSSVILVYFPRCFATREINTKITLSWALKQFVTRVHTFFSIWCREVSVSCKIVWWKSHRPYVSIPYPLKFCLKYVPGEMINRICISKTNTRGLVSLTFLVYWPLIMVCMYTNFGEKRAFVLSICNKIYLIEPMQRHWLRQLMSYNSRPAMFVRVYSLV